MTRGRLRTHDRRLLSGSRPGSSPGRIGGLLERSKPTQEGRIALYKKRNYYIVSRFGLAVSH